MVKQGDIIKLDFNPQVGHEQAGYRPALVVSGEYFNWKTKMALVCPISNTTSAFPFHIPLDRRTVTTGAIFCEHIKSLDLDVRGYKFIERIPGDILKKVLKTIALELKPPSN
jgi:mRNA interferase MazF